MRFSGRSKVNGLLRRAPVGRKADADADMTPPIPSKRTAEASRLTLGALVLMTALAGALRLWGLGGELWYDEIKTVVESVRPPLSQTLTDFPSNNDHPLFSLLSHLSISAFGESPFFVRLPAALFAIATIPMLYLFGRDAVGRLEGLLAAGLLAVSYHHVWYAQNARGYTIMLFFTLLLAWLLLKVMRSPSLRIYSIYAIIAALACYTHLTMVYVVVAQAFVVGIHLLLGMKGKFDLRPFSLPAAGFALSAALTVVLYLPVLADVQQFFVEERVAPMKQVATPGWALAATLEGVNVGFSGAVGAVVILAFLAIGGVNYLRRSPLLLLLFVLPAPLLVAAAVLLDRPMFPRFFFVLAGFALLVLVRGAAVFGVAAERVLPVGAAAPRNFIAIAIIGAFGLLSLASLPANYAAPKQNFTGAIAFVESRKAPGEALYAFGKSAHVPLADYYAEPYKMIEDAADFSAAKRPFWFVFTFPQYIERRMPDLWKEIGALCRPEAHFPGTVSGGEVVIMRCEGAVDEP
jgi:4-amino-4-deoxy-L-arabinose transferase-like glycosyltransferase